MSEAPTALALAGTAIVILWWRWVGYQGHDDAYYAAAALDWVQHFPALGTQHWALRYPLVLPTAALIRIFGFSVPALAAIDLAAYAAFLLVGYAAARHWFGWPAAAALTAIAILVPQFPVQATYANPDLLEMALVMGSFWLVMLARQRGGPWRLMLSAGVLAGVGFLTRETTMALGPLYGLMLLARPAMARWRYLLIGVGFFAVVGAQMGYFAVQTGDPLYRVRLSATHDLVDRTAQAARVTGTLDKEGVLATGLVAAPLAALFVSQKYGLLFYLAVPAYLVSRRARWLNDAGLSVLDWAALGAIASFLFVALNVGILYIVPRYFYGDCSDGCRAGRGACRKSGTAAAVARGLRGHRIRRVLPCFAVLGKHAADVCRAGRGRVHRQPAQRRLYGARDCVARASFADRARGARPPGQRAATAGCAGRHPGGRGRGLFAGASLHTACGDAAIPARLRLVRGRALRPAAPASERFAGQTGRGPPDPGRHPP